MDGEFGSQQDSLSTRCNEIVDELLGLGSGLREGWKAKASDCERKYHEVLVLKPAGIYGVIFILKTDL